MDRNTIIGFILIILVFIGFTWLNRPSQEKIEAQKRYQDSIAVVQQQAEMQAAMAQEQTLQADSLANSTLNADSLQHVQLSNKYGSFAASANGEEQLITLENELIEIKLSTKGGRIYSARLKEFTAYDSLPVTLFDAEEASFNATLVTANNRIINTSDLYFEPQATPSLVTMKLKADDHSSLSFVYSLAPNDYMVRFEIVPNNFDKHLVSGTNMLDIQWMQYISRQETGRKFEERYARLVYKYLADDMEEMKDSKDDSKSISNKLKWIGYKDQYFSSVLIADESFEASKLDSKFIPDGEYLKQYTTTTSIPFDPKDGKKTGFYFYFGPNEYALLKNYDKTHFQGQNMEMEKLVPLGWSLFRYVNKWLIIPLFDFWTSICGNVGLAILLLTISIKILLSPFTYKSYLSSAKMRVMRPQVEEINEKHPGQENAMTRQQKTMELYRQAGVNPLSGCLPMLLQMPFLFALFMFFPTAIELRHESFLWANDLSTYDAIISWDQYIPFITPYFGNHISLFCLLMTITNIFYTKYNMDQTNTGQQQMPGMKVMMYFMPIFMLIFLNQYPSGLNYYYFLSTLITILQTIGFRYFVNEEKLLAQLEANKKKPAKKKSGFMARIEEAQRQQQALAKQRAKENQKRARR